MEGDPTVTVTQAQIAQALTTWEKAAREGRCITADEARAMTPEEVGAEAAEWFFAELQRIAGAA